MPHSVTWHLPGRVLFYRLYGDVTIEELRQMTHETRRLIQIEGVEPIHSIVDLHGVSRHPVKLHEVRGVMTIDQPAEMGWCMIIASNALVRFMAGVLVQMTQARYRLVATIEDAEHFLQDMDSTLKTAVQQSK